MPSPTTGTRIGSCQDVTRINTSTETLDFTTLWTTDERQDVFDESFRENIVIQLETRSEPRPEWLLAPKGLLFYDGRFVRIDSDWLASTLSRIDDMRTIDDGWNGYSAPAPSALAINNARQFVNELYGVGTTAMRVAPSAIGGVGITLSKGEKSVYVEFYNDGSIYRMLIDDGIDTDVQPVRSDARNLELLASEATNYIDN